MENTEPAAPSASHEIAIDAPPVRPAPPAGRGEKRGCGCLGCLTIIILFLAVCGGLAGRAIYEEVKTSRFQAEYIHRYAAPLNYGLEYGSELNADETAWGARIFPTRGPYDKRLGYVELPNYIEALSGDRMRVARQARFSAALSEHVRRGLNIPYAEKDQAGLKIADRFGETMFLSRTPQRLYGQFSDIPEILVKSLTYIEDRGLLDESEPKLNPAINWRRFAKAIALRAAEKIGLHSSSMGGSTLATQMEKFRHSPQGVTGSIEEKLRQMASASVRAYKNGEDTRAWRRRLLVDYLNAVPLSAAPGFGEVNGLGDGLFVWYGDEFVATNALLREKEPTGERLVAQARAYKRALSLMIAHRRPSYYLDGGRDDLARLCDSYLRILARERIVPAALAEAALPQRLVFRDFRHHPAQQKISADKGAGMARNRLASLLHCSLYDLDRLDMNVDTTIDGGLQKRVGDYLKSLENPHTAARYGLIGKSLLRPGQTGAARYSFTLFEKSQVGAMVRVQTDTLEGPFDINEGSKLELGSTAKLRVLATYLQIVSELYDEFSLVSELELTRLVGFDIDPISRFVAEAFLRDSDIGRRAMLDQAMQRSYSADPSERFLTGGSIHSFSNFNAEDNYRVATVAESLQYSLNLPFVRLMRDIARCTSARQWKERQRLLADDDDPRRKELLDSFIDRESQVFLRRFWRKYQGKSASERLNTLLAGRRVGANRLAIIHHILFPEGDAASLGAFLAKRLPQKIAEKRLGELYGKYQNGGYNLTDLGYLSGLHPLELWLLAYLHKPGGHSLTDAIAKSAAARRDAYDWLGRAKSKGARDSRIRAMMEIDAFSDIHRRWKEMGYPFDHMVPSLASALGSSGDRPAALADLMAIIMNDGLRLPTWRFSKVEFAVGSPYETVLTPNPPMPERVFPVEVAQVLKEALAGVVSGGTARRLSGAFARADGAVFAVGGKTGTGDNRIFTINAMGERGASKALNRTATFVFYLGDGHYGTLTVFVAGRSAEAFTFTSALPLQVLKGMAPILTPVLTGARMPTPAPKPLPSAAPVDDAEDSLPTADSEEVTD
ncbi:MAG: transglycosylase domain-containing protein [Desulfobulbaceae bacterium]|nr:transglycosylase domain-containing protein [Desulfobulbaceae bacterium]